MRRYLFLLIISISIIKAHGQNENSDKINLIYKNAINLLEKNKLFEANDEFEKIIKIDPNNVDALYNLAIISEKLDDSPSAIRFLKRCVKLNDKKAANLLVKKYHYKLSYADTMQNIDISTNEKYIKLKDAQYSSLNDLTNIILSISSNKKEQLQILLLWTFDNMKADSIRFFYGGKPLSNDDAFSKRIGLCDEYSNIITEFCKTANIQNFKVIGYVKYPNFKPGELFSEANHSWNAVYLDSTWVLCDLFWSTVALKIENSSAPYFINRIETYYFLGHPEAFINDHLPCDPVFQFSNYPIVFDAFIKKRDGIDSTIQRMNYMNYIDSLDVLSKMSMQERLLQIAKHSYEYNRTNPNELIVEAYNYAVDVLNKKTVARPELLKAKEMLELALAIIDFSKDANIRALKDNCKTGIEIANRRLNK